MEVLHRNERNSGEGGTTRHQEGCKCVAMMKEEDFKERQEGLEKVIFDCDKPEYSAQFIAREDIRCAGGTPFKPSTRC